MYGIKFESFAKCIFEWKINVCVGLSVCNICTYICIYIYVQKRLYYRPIVSTMTKAQLTPQPDSCTALYGE